MKPSSASPTSLRSKQAKQSSPNIRLIGSLHPLRGAFWVRKDTNMKTIADFKGKKVGMGYSAMRTIDPLVKAILATGGLTEKDIVPVLIPNVIRGADDFASGAADMFFFAFGAPKVREVDATVGGIRALEISESGMAAAKKLLPEGYLTPGVPNGFFIGVEKPMRNLHLGQYDLHQRQGAGRRRLQVHRYAGEEQGRTRHHSAGACAISAPPRSTRSMICRITPAP